MICLPRGEFCLHEVWLLRDLVPEEHVEYSGDGVYYSIFDGAVHHGEPSGSLTAIATIPFFPSLNAPVALMLLISSTQLGMDMKIDTCK